MKNPNTTTNLLNINEINDAIKNVVLAMGDPSTVRDACMHILGSPGKRLRPMLVLSVAQTLGASYSVLDAAIAMELFHTSSLVADDLPCMDDDDFRRGLATIHKKYGEDIAVMSVIALITEGYSLIKNAGRVLQKNNVVDGYERTLTALEIAGINAGIQGLVGGQVIDITLDHADIELCEKMIHMKTSALFEASLQFGWIFGGGDLLKCDEVKQVGRSIGMAFQVLDDFDDFEEDKKENQYANYVLVAGAEVSIKRVYHELEKARDIAERYGLYVGLLKECIDTMEKRAGTFYRDSIFSYR
jgi:geranylgeranyl diphosphate synthase, type II